MRRLRWLHRVVLPFLLATFFVAGVAHASHLHKEESARTGTHAMHCGQCLQFDRITSVPDLPRLLAGHTRFVRLSVARHSFEPDKFSTHLYEARGPPPHA